MDLQFSQHPRIARYPENNWVSKLDVRFTSLLANLPLTSVPLLTFIPFLFGHAFGAPVISLVTLPPLLMTSHPYVQMYAVLMSVAWLFVFYYTKSRKVLENPTFILTGFIGNIGLALHLESNAMDAYCAYLCSWFYATVVCFLGKTYFLRSRPALKGQENTSAQDSATTIERSISWRHFTQEHSKDPNGYHSFPSFDAASSACFCTTLYLQHHHGVGTVPAPAWLWSIIPLACFGRIYFRAHHVVDVFVGTAIGFVCASYVHFVRLPSWMTLSGTPKESAVPLLHDLSPQHHYDVVWLLLCLVSIGLFFAVPKVGPVFALAVTSLGIVLLPTTSLNSIFGTMWVGGLFWWQFNRQSRDHKPWVVKTLETFFRMHPIPPNDLCPSGKTYPKHLSELLENKRNEFLDQARNTDEAHPGNLYVIHQFRFSKRMKAMREQGGTNLITPKDNVYLVCGWRHLYELIEIRVDHFLQSTGTNEWDWDVIVGIYSGGAIIAPFFARMFEIRKSHDKLNVQHNSSTKKNSKISGSSSMPVCYIKCSRYDTCNMDPISLTKVTLDVALNRHDEQYKVSKPPLRKQVDGKRCLMVDDASVSGGTFRATAKHLREELGAADCKGLALCDFNGVTHIYDPERDVEKMGPITVQKLDVGTFTPWGTF
jgi:hypoxanthine phosphoribosyltransferase/membrane-associated phospholipid phosphatase